MKNIFLSIFFGMIFANLCEAQLNDYKYVIVPKKFEGFKSENQYQTSTLIKYLFSEKGFNVVYDDALPVDLNANRCLGLLVGLEDQSSMFTTKVILHLKDCNSAVVFSTGEGKSKLKEYKAAFNASIREAFESFNGISYSYSPKKAENGPITLNFNNDVKKMGDDKLVTPKNKVSESVVIQEATKETQLYKSMEPVESNIVKNESPTVRVTATEVLYAQEIPNGFQLVDSTPKVVLKIYNSAIPDQYLASSDEKNGIVYFKNEKWYFEYLQNGQQTIEELNIKF